MTQNAGFRELLGLELVESEERRAVVELQAGDGHHNPGGTVHGGAVATRIARAMARDFNL